MAETTINFLETLPTFTTIYITNAIRTTNYYNHAQSKNYSIFHYLTNFIPPIIIKNNIIIPINGNNITLTSIILSFQ